MTTELQRKKAEEVQRIMKERGFTSASEKSHKPKKHINKTLIFLVVILVSATAGIFYLSNNPQKTSPTKEIVSNNTTQEEDNSLDFYVCIGHLSSENIPIEDPDFYPKLIAKYQTNLDCYIKYPGVGSYSDEQQLRQTIASLTEQAKTAGITQNQIENSKKDMDALIAQSEVEYNSNKAAYDTYSANRETQSPEAPSSSIQQNNSTDWAQQQKQQKQQKCEAFKAKYGGKTAEQAADNDEDVMFAKAEYEEAKKDYNIAYKNYWGKKGVMITANKLSIYEEKMKVAKNIVDNKFSIYNSKRNSIISQYNTGEISCNTN